MPPELKALERVSILGLPLDLVDLETTINILRDWARASDPKQLELGRTVITLNPEIVVQSETEPSLRAAIEGADLVTADGVGIVWAAGRLVNKKPARATGVDIAVRLMELEGQNLRVYFLGAKPGVAQRAAQACQEKYGIQIAGFRDGYFKPADLETVVRDVRESRADLLLAGLGAGRQEIFNHTQRPAKICIGCGGTIDVLAGAVELAPDWTRKLGIEWVWRITTMGRWARAWRLVEFVGRVLRAKR